MKEELAVKVQNELAAKILSEVISEGMKLSNIDLGERVKCEATNALDEIKLTMHKTGDEKAKLAEIKKIMRKYNIGNF